MSDDLVRAATPTDVETVQQVAAASWHAAHNDIIGAEVVDEFLAHHYDRQTITDAIRDDRSAYRIAELGDEVVGFAVAVPHDDATWGLGAIYVLPQHWGDGIGTALLTAVEDAARAAGAERLRFVVMTENERARRFYESQGYEHIADGYDDSLDIAEATYARALRDYD